MGQCKITNMGHFTKLTFAWVGHNAIVATNNWQMFLLFLACKTKNDGNLSVIMSDCQCLVSKMRDIDTALEIYE